MINYENLASEISELLQQYVKNNGEVATAIIDVIKKNMEMSLINPIEYINDAQSAMAETVTKSIQDGWKAAADMNEALLGVNAGKTHFDSFLRVVRKDEGKENK